MSWKRAICITNGEQGENHVGMQKIGNGLAEHGYSLAEMREIAKKFDSMGGHSEWVDLNKGLDGTGVVGSEAAVLLLKNGVNVLLKNRIQTDLTQAGLTGKDYDSAFLKKFWRYNARRLFEEQFSFDWDTKFWNSRRKVVQNKHARYNVCYDTESQEPDYAQGKGTVVAYSSLPIMKLWRCELLKLCGEKESEFKAEGNLYYDVKKTGIGFHGDGERRKIVAGNFSDVGVVREINWIWYSNGERIGKRTKVYLENGDMYIMSEKAAGTDWKRKKIPTLRHAAGVEGSKYLK